MTLKDRINDDLKAAMRGGDTRRRDALRLLLAALKQREVDERKALADADVVTAVDKLIKQRREAIAQFEKGGRQDLVAGQELVYGMSITDACLAWDSSVDVIAELSAAVEARRRKNATEDVSAG